MDETPEGTVQVQTFWQVNPGAVPLPVNQVMIQGGGVLGNGENSGEYYLSFGHLTPPAITAGPDGKVDPEAFANLVLPISVVGQFHMSRPRLEEFRVALNEFLDRN
jgi:hypothetical protein